MNQRQKSDKGAIVQYNGENNDRKEHVYFSRNKRYTSCTDDDNNDNDGNDKRMIRMIVITITIVHVPPQSQLSATISVTVFTCCLSFQSVLSPKSSRQSRARTQYMHVCVYPSYKLYRFTTSLYLPWESIIAVIAHGKSTILK